MSYVQHFIPMIFSGLHTILMFLKTDEEHLMTDDLKKNFEDLLKKGEYAEADKLLVAYMKESPKDLDAKLLYGTCRMMQGDSGTAKQIHDEVEPQISESNDISETQKTFWQKYKKLIIYGAIGTALVYGGYKVYEGYKMYMTASLPTKYAGPLGTHLMLEAERNQNKNGADNVSGEPTNVNEW